MKGPELEKLNEKKPKHQEFNVIVPACQNFGPKKSKC